MISLVSLQAGALPLIGYIGPGPGLSMLGALFGLIATVVAALGAVLLWPIRAMLGNLDDEEEKADDETSDDETSDDETAAASDETQPSSGDADDDSGDGASEASDDSSDGAVEVAGDDNPETSDVDESTGASAGAR